MPSFKRSLALILAVLAGAALETWVGERVYASGIVQSAYSVIQNAGSALIKRTILNFTGTGISCSDVAGITVCNVPGIPTGFATQSFTNLSTWTFTHNLNTTLLIYGCWTSDMQAISFDPGQAVQTDANTLTFNMEFPQSGFCVANSQSGGNASIIKLMGSASIAFSSSIPDGACAVGPSTITVAGANTGDQPIVAPLVPLASGVESYAKATGSNTVTVEVCNFSGGAVTPGTTTYTAEIFH
jgi:hypothetical protein